jgi:hypothetical protein
MKPKNMILVYDYRLGSWISPAGNKLTDKMVEMVPTYFSLRLGLYKIVNILEYQGEQAYAQC